MFKKINIKALDMGLQELGVIMKNP